MDEVEKMEFVLTTSVLQFKHNLIFLPIPIYLPVSARRLCDEISNLVSADL